MKTKTFAAPAFTLVELLVTLAILIVLAAILLPVLNKAVEDSRSVNCLSNLRQMAAAAHGYAIRNEDLYPIAYYFDAQGTTGYAYCWDLTTISPASGASSVQPGILWDGVGLQKILQCPSFDGPANWIDNPYTGYNYNTSYIGHGQYEAIVAPARLSGIQRPSETALFGDGQYAAGADKFMRAPWPSAGDATFWGRWAGTQGYRHLGRTNVAFCDEHAESLADRFTQNSDGAANVAPGTGFLSRDNSRYGG